MDINSREYEDDRKRLDSMNPSQWIASTKRIHGEKEALEKKLQPKDPELLREWTALDKGFLDNLQIVKKKILWFKALLDKIQIKLDDKLGFHDQHAKELLQNMLETFESKLAAFKLSMRTDYDRLEEGEQMLSHELHMLSENISLNMVNDNLPASPRESPAEKAAKQKQSQQRMQEEVEQKAAVGEIDRELTILGKTGGWDPRDHDAFLRTWNATFAGLELVQRVPSPDGEHDSFQVNLSSVQQKLLLRRLEHDVFGKLKSELEEHFDWYCKVLQLQAKKKQLLNDWRKAQWARKRNQDNELLVAEHLVRGKELLELVNVEDDDEAKLREEEEKRIQAKQRIEKWKVDRVKLKEQEDLLKKQQSVKEQRAAVDERKKRQTELKVQLDVWKKEVSDKTKKVIREEPRLSSRAKVEEQARLKERQQRDLELARMRKAKADNSASKKTERERKISEAGNLFEGDVVRDPARLLIPTKASEAAKIHEEELDAAHHRRATAGAHNAPVAMTGRDLHFGGRATPAWMKPR